jgi:prepilin signal peptidase PulO-like enzyme (type II secretory pathway)
MSFAERWNDLALLVPHLVALVFAFAFGASAGSFINVVAWRMPLNMSIVSPPSRCPTCGYRLRWMDNLPVLGYLRLKGRCAACGIGIPVHYVLIEVCIGVMFAAVYAVLFLPKYGSFWYPVGQGWWDAQGLARSTPALIVVLFTLSSLAAMTLADARTFHIPLAIPTLASVVAFLGWLVQSGVAGPVSHPWPVDLPAWPLQAAGIGGLIGVLISAVLLKTGTLKPSFADYDHYVKPGETFAQYPHSRREVARELLFLSPAAALASAGYLASAWILPWISGGGQHAPLWLQSFGACAVGFVAGGAIIWVVRIAVTFVLDVEAMGLGDVHLMACVGAAFGWRAVVVGFIVAPFIGLAWWLANLARHAPMRVPFGPSLAIGGASAFFLLPVLTSVFAGMRHAMSFAATAAREHPGWALGLSVVAAAMALPLSFRAGRSPRRVGVNVAGAILAMVIAVIAWIFGSPRGRASTVVVAAILAVTAVGCAALAKAQQEEEAGPRTALRRIMTLLVVVILLLGLLLAVATPPSTAN